MKSKELYQRASEYFAKAIEAPVSELVFGSTYELLVAVILSAQCTDKRVNMVTPALFAAYPTVEDMARAGVEDVFSYIKSVSYPNAKANHLSQMSRAVVAHFGGEIPSNRLDLQTLAGVGRKTASVVLAVAFNEPEMAVDTHVFRVGARIGLTVGAKTPQAAEKQLVKGFLGVDASQFGVDNIIGVAHHWLILHGRYVCTARKPKCEECGLTEFCKYFNNEAQ